MYFIAFIYTGITAEQYDKTVRDGTDMSFCVSSAVMKKSMKTATSWWTTKKKTSIFP